jgi:hypothetical protein
MGRGRHRPGDGLLPNLADPASGGALGPRPGAAVFASKTQGQGQWRAPSNGAPRSGPRGRRLAPLGWGLTSQPDSGTVRDMSEIELGPLSDRLDDDEIKTLHRLLDQAGAKYSYNDDQQTLQTIATRLSEDAMTEFMDRLEAHDLAADIYLPVEFEGRLSVGEYRVASSQQLVDVLEEMKEELSVDEEYHDEEDEEDEPDEGTVIEAQLRNIWRLVNDACSESIDKSVPLHLRV